MRWFWRLVTWTAGSSAAFFIFAIALPSFMGSTYSAPNATVAGGGARVVESLPKLHLETPEPLKAIYMTACVANTPSWREDLKKLIEATELNAVMIDVKDYTGVVSFPRLHQDYGGQANKGCVVSDMKEFIQSLHDSNIYVIGRISVFQDVSYVKLFPELAVKKKSDGGVWKDHKGLTFVDVGAKPYWDYIVEIAKASYELGFDELNFDYVRYPSDGNMQDVEFTWTHSTSSGQAVTKAEMLENFFSYLHDNLKDTGAKTSVDLFGMTTSATSDMGIGQVLERALPYFDYLAPMVYPSHYPKNWHGFANPAEYPYEVIQISMSQGLERERAYNIVRGDFTLDESGATTTPRSKLRPWLQDFNLGATYGSDEVLSQIKAIYDIGLTSWMLWNAGNRYTQEALVPEGF